MSLQLVALKNSTKLVDRKYLKTGIKDIKVCRVSTVPFFIVSQLKSQIEYLRDIGMNVVLVASDGPEWSEIELGHGLSQEIVEIPRSLRPLKDLVAFIRLIRVFRKHKFDVVHSTTPKAGLLTAIAAFIVRVPVRVHTYTGQRWLTLKGPMRWISRLADKIIGILNARCYADSKSQRQFLVDERIITSEKIAVIGHGSLAGVDLDRFNPRLLSASMKRKLKESLAINPGSKVITLIGRITRDKGIPELISAFRKLLQKKYDVDLLLVGPLDQDYRGTGSDYFLEVKRCPRTHYVGYTVSPEYYLAISDVLCLPSYREGFGTVVIEAAAMGIPTIGTHINGLIDAVVDGKTGILVPSHNDQALLEALSQLLDNPDLAYQMGKAARQRCVRNFDADIVNKKVAEEYISILKKIKA